MNAREQHRQQQNQSTRNHLRSTIRTLVQQEAKCYMARTIALQARCNSARRVRVYGMRQKARELPDLVDRLERLEAKLAANIASKQEARSSPLPQRTAPVAEVLREPPERITVLLVTANPLGAPALRLDEEIRSVVGQIRQSRYRRSIKLESCLATRPQDLLTALNEFRPTIMHFSGHGSRQSELAFLDNDGYVKLISQSGIIHAIAHAASVRLVFFNACHSRTQAAEVVRYVDAAIGMNRAVDDTAARLFASQFYAALASGLSVKDAFEQARALLMMEGIAEADTPELFVADGLDPGSITLVRRRRS